MRILTRVVALKGGANLLGMFELLVLLGIGWSLLDERIPADNRWNQAVLTAMGCSMAVIDLTWRVFQTQAGRVWRWFSPFDGGCFLFFPGWVLGTLLAAYAIFARLQGV